MSHEKGATKGTKEESQKAPDRWFGWFLLSEVANFFLLLLVG